MKRLNKGFTLMELLIVIAVLGILAAGLLAAIDPFEQLRKANDTNNRNATVELVTSMTRYYASYKAYPWNETTPKAGCSRATGGDLIDLKSLSTGVLPVTTAKTCLTNSLILVGELKDTYFTGIGSTPIYIASDPADKTNFVACFAPESKSARLDSSTKYYLDTTSGVKFVDQTGATTPVCPAVGSSSCYQCYR